MLTVVSILLVIDRDAIPIGGRGIFVVVQSGCLTIQRDGLEEQVIV